ncbi:alkaline phosphatase [Gulosibacter sediminis]|uniref:alkaline phosphatase n=1 Tax=Gulosibacter sediminis TaxID=1729695 RepID=UPI0024AD6719|nr:alkaline phosphatase [Gulosibacter sediminis]
MKTRNFVKSLSVCGTAAAVALGSFAFATPASAATAADGPKNVILLIGDGMGYNHLDNMNAYENNEVYWQVDRGGDNKVKPWGGNSTPTEGFQSWEHTSMETAWYEQTPYDSFTAWNDFESSKENPTDSAAAGTAMATGHKTYNAGIGVDYEGNVVENVSERADALDKSAGVVSSVPFSHATPAAFSAHNANRNDYHGIAADQISNGYMDVVMGAGHPYYNDDNEQQATGDFSYISEESYNQLAAGETDFTFVEDDADFEALTTGETPETVFGLAQVGSTLQQGRSDEAAYNDVVSLSTMTEGALNVLDNNENGFFLMVEGGAIDWAGHANQTQRDIDETVDFSAAVDSVVNWVETNSSWDDTLVIVTADHETGYLSGANYVTDNDGNQIPVEGSTDYVLGDWGPMTPNGTGTPATQDWFSNNHTTMLVPYFVKGAYSEDLLGFATGHDLVRTDYLSNVDMASWLLDTAWVASEQTPEPTPTTEPEPTTDPEPTTEPTATAEATATATTDPTASATSTDAPAAGNQGDSTEADGGSLATTGADAFGPIAIAAAVLLVAGAAFMIIRRRGQGEDA